MVLILEGLIESLFMQHQRWRFCNSKLILICNCLGQKPFTIKQVSSAKTLGWYFKAKFRLLI